MSAGLQYGKAVPDRVKRSIGLYARHAGRAGFRRRRRKSRLIGQFARQIAAFGAHYLEEMRGIADGAGVSLDDIVLINARTEVVAQARREKNKPEAEDDAVDGCTGAIILAERSSTGRVIHGMNWDWRAECAETAIVLRVSRDDGPDFMTFVEAGGAGALRRERCRHRHHGELSGIGARLQAIRHSVGAHPPQGAGAEAFRHGGARGGGNAQGLLQQHDAEHRGRLGHRFRMRAGRGVSDLSARTGMIVHANHWVSPVALAKLKDAGLLGDSFYRDWRVQKLLVTAGKISPDDLKAAFFDDFAAPFAVCRPVLPNSAGDLSATVAMIIMDSTAGTDGCGTAAGALPRLHALQPEGRAGRPGASGGVAGWASRRGADSSQLPGPRLRVVDRARRGDRPRQGGSPGSDPRHRLRSRRRGASSA